MMFDVSFGNFWQVLGLGLCSCGQANCTVSCYWRARAQLSLQFAARGFFYVLANTDSALTVFALAIPVFALLFGALGCPCSSGF